MEKPIRDDVAVFVDFENVYVSVREKFDATPNFELIMDRCEDYGRIVIARAYADWYRYPRVTSALFANGVEPMYVPTYYYDRDAGRTGRPIKNSVDIHLCIDVMRTLYAQPHILKYVLVTGDRDFIPLVNAIRQQGKEVIIIGIGGAASAHLAQSGDEFLFYEQIADLKAPGQLEVQARMLAAQEQTARPQEGRPRNGDRAERSDRGEQRNDREGGDREERGDRRDRGEQRGDRRDRNERRSFRSDTAPEPLAEEQPAAEFAPEVAAEVPASTPEAVPTAPTETVRKSPYDTLVDAIQLARQRGFVVNLGSLKVVMRELDSTFHEAKVKDNNGKGFVKFKDFVKEAENRGKVQIFTNGTVTEVFLPGEDPYRMSQFAEDLTSSRVENELDHELAAQDQQVAAPISEAPMVIDEPVAASVEVEATVVDLESDSTPLAAPATVEPEAEEDPGTEVIRRTFADREWDVFRTSISQFGEPVRFNEIFNALRGLRNQEVVELTNNELKELVKQAINKGMLQRTGRGAKAYYRLSSQYRVPAVTTSEAAPAEAVNAGTPEQPSTTSTPASTRRSRMYAAQAAAATGPAPAEQAPEAVAPTATEAAPVATVTVEATGEPAAEPAPAAKPRRTRKKAPAAEAAPEPVAAEPATPNRRRRAKAQAAPAGESAAAEAAPVPAPAAEAGSGTNQRRRRRKPADNNGETQG